MLRWFLLHSTVNLRYIYIFPLFWISFPSGSPQSTEFPALHSRDLNGMPARPRLLQL